MRRDPHGTAADRPIPAYTKSQRFFGWVVCASSTVLESRDKLLWELLSRYDKPERPTDVRPRVGGCFLAQPTMAELLGGWSERTVRRRLDALEQFGLVARIGATSETRWFAVIPECVLQWHASGSGNPEGKRQAHQSAVRLLDAAIAERLSGHSGSPRRSSRSGNLA